MDPLTAAVAALAVYRLTLLVTADTITAPHRDAAIQWLNVRHWGPRPLQDPGARIWDEDVAVNPHKLAVLLDCPWCASVWLAPPVVASALWWSDGWAWWLTAGSLAASAVTGILATLASPEH